MSRLWWSPWVVLVVLCVGAPALEAQEGSTDARKEAAVSLYQVAVEEFQKGDYAEALLKLQEVYKLDPNPIILYNIARSYEELGRPADAAEYFQQAGADDTLPANLRTELGVRLPRVMPALKAREATNISTRAVIFGIKQAEDKAQAAFMENQRRLDGIEEPVPLTSDPLFWTGVGTEVLGLGLLAAGFAIDLGLEDPINELKSEETRADSARTLSLQDDIDRDQTLALVLYVSGGVLAATGAALLYYSIDSNLSETAQPPGVEATGFRLSPMVGSDTVGLQLGGSLPWP